ncbi:MAG: ribose ABC transporter permease [Firmicutes bacterium]|nr:ribose ABC transporter permease [Bacillota bacterium]
MMKEVRKIGKPRRDLIRRYGMLLVLIVMVLLASMLSDRFLTTANLINVMRQVAINAILAAGMTIVIISGGIDLSIGSVVAISGALGAGVMASGQGWFVGVLVTLMIGLLFGITNGLFIAYGQLPPFIVTLATMALARGFTQVYTGGRAIAVSNATFQWFGHGYIGTIPVPVIIMIFVYVLAYIFFKHMKLGRLVYAVGGNEQACRMAGIRVNRVKVAIFGINGLLAGLVGVILTARLFSAQPTAGVSYEMDAIAAVILGGTSLAGGRGNIGGTIIGALIIGVLGNVFNLLDVSPFYQDVAKGLVILVAVLLDRLLHAGGGLRKGVSSSGDDQELDAETMKSAHA